jgi:hypothetical protein
MRRVHGERRRIADQSAVQIQFIVATWDAPPGSRRRLFIGGWHPVCYINVV